jgi:hypothetical protein
MKRPRNYRVHVSTGAVPLVHTRVLIDDSLGNTVALFQDLRKGRRRLATVLGRALTATERRAKARAANKVAKERYAAARRIREAEACVERTRAVFQLLALLRRLPWGRCPSCLVALTAPPGSRRPRQTPQYGGKRTQKKFKRHPRRGGLWDHSAAWHRKHWPTVTATCPQCLTCWNLYCGEYHLGHTLRDVFGDDGWRTGTLQMHASGLSWICLVRTSDVLRLWDQLAAARQRASA